VIHHRNTGYRTLDMPIQCTGVYRLLKKSKLCLYMSIHMYRHVRLMISSLFFRVSTINRKTLLLNQSFQ